MAQKKKTNPTAKGQSSPAKKYGVVILILAVAAFFMIKNLFMNNGEPEVKYYTFTKEGELVFSDTLGNQKIKIDIEIADSEYERQLGLMNRKSMEENQGMLFIFNEERLQSFWMLNTLISLDILYVSKEKRIVTIHKNTVPLSRQSYPSTDPAIYVVEVVGGFCDRHDIIVGDKISWMGTKL